MLEKNEHHITAKNLLVTLQSALLVVTLIFLLIDKLVLPSVREASSITQAELIRNAAVLAGRVTRVEDMILSLKDVAADIAALKVTADRNRETLSEIGKKLDAHIAR